MAIQVTTVVRSHESVGTILLHAGRALVTFAPDAAQARIALGTDADTISNSDASFSFTPNPDGCADDFVADATRIIRRALVSIMSAGFLW